MPTDPPILKDMGTGVSHQRWHFGDATMDIEIDEHPYRQLKGKAFITLTETVPAFVNDEWLDILGANFRLPGGCELDIDNEELERALEDIEFCGDLEDVAARRSDLVTTDPELLVPAVINDVDLPMASVLIPLSQLQSACQAVESGKGSHARGGMVKQTVASCSHQGVEIGRHNCRSCMRRFWTIKAREKGLIE